MIKKGGSIRRSNRGRKALRKTKKANSNLTPKYASLNLPLRRRSTPKKPTSGVIHAKLKFPQGSNPKKNSLRIRRSNSKRRALKGNPRIKVTKVSTWGNN